MCIIRGAFVKLVITFNDYTSAYLAKEVCTAEYSNVLMCHVIKVPL